MRGRVGPLSATPRLPLGIDGDETYVDATVTFAPGDMLVLYTDGIIEAHNATRDEMFGQERLDAVLCAVCDDAKGLVRRVLEAVDSFTGYRAPEDDRTMLVAKVS